MPTKSKKTKEENPPVNPKGTKKDPPIGTGVNGPVIKR
jgi:hypothetical protein|uniref:Uncharacterized protein n=1 Tax=Myoviridae sp. ctByu2 TaxID=2827668 RepID=A0A8S5S9U0_9CAUD|nr:MAG TPA: hypothetical protein [Myoviridae sp. ctByu2]